MPQYQKKAFLIVMLAGILAACQPAAPTDLNPTSPPSTNPSPSETPTEVPPTETPAPTETLVPPTPTRHRVQSLHEWADLSTGKGPVYSQDWSPDGLLLVTADTDQIRIWNVSTRRESGVLAGHTSFVWGLAWSPITLDGTSLLVSASEDGTVRLWDVAANTATATLNTGWAFCVDWSPDGQQLAVGTNAGEVQIWDVASQQMLHTWQSPTHTAVLSLGWSPDGNTIASGEWAGEIYLWDVGTGQVRQTITGYSNEPSDVNGLAWSPDGSTLATTHPDGQVRLWNPATGQLTLTIDAHTGWARGMAWSPDGNLLASTGEDRRIVLWDLVTGLAYAEQHHNRLPVWSVSWSPDGTMVASGAGAYLERHVGATIVWRVP